jgi:hypothetical protein
MVLLAENPEARGPMMANHGAIPLLDLIENSKQSNLVLKLLNILNMVRCSAEISGAKPSQPLNLSIDPIN